MRDRDAALLLEIETAIRYIESFIASLDEQSFLQDSRTSAAVAMYLIVVGESARTLGAEAISEAPEIPWPQVIALRNRIAHGYQTIDRAAIWAITQAHLPPLRLAVRRMLSARGEPPPSA
ncbi:MAG: HepT-like ribonuclease domain-containing protein [Terricaulis sp.]